MNTHTFCIRPRKLRPYTFRDYACMPTDCTYSPLETKKRSSSSKLKVQEEKTFAPSSCCNEKGAEFSGES